MDDNPLGKLVLIAGEPIRRSLTVTILDRQPKGWTVNRARAWTKADLAVLAAGERS